MTQRYLVVLDFPGIKQFVFGTDRLVEIRGASAILDQLNRHVIQDMLHKIFVSRSQCVFAGGGAGQFIINDTFKNIQEAFAAIQGEIYRNSGGALRLITGITPLEGDYALALARAFLDLKQNKQKNPFEPCSWVHTGFIRECESCSGMASVLSSYAGDSKYLCQTCFRKEKKGQERGLWDEFTAYLQQQYSIDPIESWKWRPDDFEKIGDLCQSRAGYTALVYGDGNAMGQLVKRINTEERFKLFSKAVDEAVRESCYESLWRHCQTIKGKIPADILLLGGDDLMVYLSAATAMPFAIDVAKLFEAKTREKLTTGTQDTFFKDILGNHGLTISIGIAYGRSHTPISIMVDQAEELLKSAKKKGSSLVSKGHYTPACIDFHLTSQYNQVSVSDSRKQHLVYRTPIGEKIRLYFGPYTLEESEDLIEHAQKLKESGIPNSRMHRLGDAPFKGKMNGTIETLTVYGRCRGKKQEKNIQKQAIWNALNRYGCMPVMPWNEGKNETSTVMVDLVEISGFTQLKKEGVHDASSNPT